MSEQDYDEPEEELDSSDEVDDYARETEFDERTLRSNEQRSRFLFVAMSFLLALLCLSAYLNHQSPLMSNILLLGIVFFAAIGIFLLLRGDTAIQSRSPAIFETEPDEEHPEDAIVEGSSEQPYSELTPFELLVQQALASIPQEFQERMDNVFVQVEYQPGQEVLRRIGTKEGYTLLGLYEGVPMTAYGRHYSSQPETITIYQRTIERYCHGDPDRIREQVRQTVLHEVAHHFGIDHDEMPIWIK